MNIVPILNANDVVAEAPHQDADLKQVSEKPNSPGILLITYICVYMH